MNAENKESLVVQAGETTAMQKVLDWAYDKATNPVLGLDSAQDLAANYLGNGKSDFDNANTLIRWQLAKAGTSGFLTGLGGFITMPVAIPANIASVMYIQIRMIAAIAHMGGYDLKSDQVRTFVYCCMAGNGVKDFLKDSGIVFGKKMTQNMIGKISGKTLTKINQWVGFRLVTKAGEKGVLNLSKAVPFIGGIIGGGVDIAATNIIGNVARDFFVPALPVSIEFDT